MTAARSQLGVVGPMGRDSVLQPGLPSPARLQSEGHFCLLPSQRILPTASAWCYCSWSGHGRTHSSLGLAEGSGCRPRTTLGLCRQLPVSSMIYLSICIDNQRINDLCVFFFFI